VGRVFRPGYIIRMDPALAVYAALDAAGIPYQRLEHPPVFTAEQAAEHWAGVDATQCKNLFLRNKKGNHHYLVVLEISKQADLRYLAKLVHDDRLSFGSPERLMAKLGLTPGSVSPFGLLNDHDRSVRVLIDKDLRKSQRVIFHPNINTASVVVAWSHFETFLEARGNVVSYVNVEI
jgi:Ala-tRNA(Pro) deacylase